MKYCFTNQRLSEMTNKKAWFVFLIILINCGQALGQLTQTPIRLDTKNLLVSVDPNTCRWSAEVKGTAMQMNDIYFLPGDDPSGWKVASSVDKDDSNNLGSFMTVTLVGTKPGQLDFNYKISVSKTNNDIIVSLGRSNNTGKSVDIQDMEYFVSSDARLGSTTDRWISLGTQSQNRELYELWPVINLITPRLYIVNHVIKDSDTDNSLLMGHITANKGASRFEITSGWQGKLPDRMRVRAFCSYKITMPTGKSFEGEKLLINFSTNALRSMEHQGDLIAIYYDVRLKQRKPIDLNDIEMVSNSYTRFHGWMSGSPRAFGGALPAGMPPGMRGPMTPAEFFKENGLVDFYWGVGGPGRQGSWGIYGSGGSTSDRYPIYDRNDTNWVKYGMGMKLARRSRTNYPEECYLPIRTVKFGGEKVIDFSNPLSVKLERERAYEWAKSQANLTVTARSEMDFSDWWDKWPGQFDPFISALEAYRLGGAPWREAIEKLSPRTIIRSNMAPVDHFYGLVDIMRVSEDADQGYEDKESAMSESVFTGLFAETVMGSAIRFFYNGRVFWNDGDGFHIYKFQAPHGKVGSYDYGQAKVVANFRAISGSTLLLSEALNEKYPENRIELLKRISPVTMDVSYPVDLFVRKPARVWNLPVERLFGKWCILGVFNYTNKTSQEQDVYDFITKLDAAKDLRLDPNKEYIVYEFWSKQLIGTFKETFVTRPLNPYNCDIYSIVEKQDHPVLISTSRNIRQMAVDIKDLSYDTPQRMLKGVSRMVANDPYQLRIYVPEGFTVKRLELSEGLKSTMKTEGNLLTVDYKSSTGKDVEWKVFF
jgi:hypothetical protein